MESVKECLKEISNHNSKTIKLKEVCKKHLENKDISLDEKWELLNFINNIKSYLVDREEAPLLRDYTDSFSDRHEVAMYQDLIDRIEDEGWEFVGEEEDYSNTRLTKESEDEIKAIKQEASNNGYIGCVVDW